MGEGNNMCLIDFYTSILIYSGCSSTYTPSVITSLMLRLLLLNDQLPSAIELVHDRTALEHGQLLRLLIIECSKLGRIRLVL